MGEVPLLTIKIEYPIDNPGNFKIDSDIKPEMYAEVLSAFLQGQIGQGTDPSPAEDRDVYRIQIQLDLEDDSFYLKADTGNKDLTAGIVMDVLKRLPKPKVE